LSAHLLHSFRRKQACAFRSRIEHAKGVRVRGEIAFTLIGRVLLPLLLGRLESFEDGYEARRNCGGRRSGGRKKPTRRYDGAGGREERHGMVDKHGWKVE
jgi:hypothetical protein